MRDGAWCRPHLVMANAMSDKKIRNMEEFATVSGISRPTLSKYFNDPDSVRLSTRKKIEAALERYEYRPNIFAVNQNRKLTKVIGIIVPYLADPFFGELARTLEFHCLAAGFRPRLFSSHGQQDLENEALSSLQALKPVGVLLAPLGRKSDLSVIEKFCAKVPTVLVDSNLPEIRQAYIGSNTSQFADLIVEYLCETGAPPCFFEMKTPANPNANRRRQSYIHAMERLGHTPSIVQAEGEGWDFEGISRRQGVKILQDKGFKTSTVLCSNDRLAIGLLTACYELNLRVGGGEDDDIRVAGQDNHPFSRYTCPPLTTVSQDYDAISKNAVNLLLYAIKGGAYCQESQFYDGKLIIRQST